MLWDGNYSSLEQFHTGTIPVEEIFKQTLIFTKNNYSTWNLLCWKIHVIRLFRIISIPSKFCYFRPPDHVILMECIALDFRCQCTQQKLQSICAVLTFDPQLKTNLNIFCKRQLSIKLFYLYQRLEYRDNYFLQSNEFSFFICCCQHHETKTICLYILLISDRYWGTEHQYFFSRFIGISILQLLII